MGVLLTVALCAAALYPTPAAAFLGPAPMMGRVRAARASASNLQMQSGDSEPPQVWVPGSSQEQSLWLPPSSHVNRRDALRYSAGSVLAAATAASSPLPAYAAQGRDLPSLASKAPKGDSVTLSNGGGKFRLVSFGLQVYDDETARKNTLIALDAGVRNFFASVLAGNQIGFAKAIKESGIPREELYICGSVVSNRAKGFDAAYKSTAQGCEENMKAFAVGGIDYLDQVCESVSLRVF